MSDGEFFAWHIFAIIGAICAGALIEHYSHKRRILPPPRRMTK